MAHEQQMQQMKDGKGFIAALDQSGGSTPKALAAYGVDADAYGSEAEMFDMIHAMRTRIVEAPAFTGDKVIGAILFEMTMDREMNGVSCPTYLWEHQGVVPFLKVDKGLADAQDGVQMMKPMPGLDALCKRAVEKGVFGTKMRSVVGGANAAGIKANVGQQFEVGQQILSHGLVPILEPEVTISIADKAEAEAMVLDACLEGLEQLPGDDKVIFKLTLPEVANHYKPLVDHPRVLRVVALSGGYSLEEANRRLAQNTGIIASFSRALTQGLSAGQSDDAFNSTIAETIDSIYAASVAG